MFTEHFLTTLSKEGVAPILTWTDSEPHLAATWNSYITVKEKHKLLVPVFSMKVLS